ncbi:hypothetical protein CANCADRAFT_86890 [Tortispora caseinolytica NRRL Y-17796]|uniref:Uncharacterized protein n=1 Tax=Tortispora caseinolytica NRRL Y-17796 TaxID=767744 RepID=A0A1E4TKZ8_9ASCO|nr:hypothetical protein CANCADRAFT_86890 [Tortispora caseinolytica NRRL Y-17796]
MDEKLIVRKRQDKRDLSKITPIKVSTSQLRHESSNKENRRIISLDQSPIPDLRPPAPSPPMSSPRKVSRRTSYSPLSGGSPTSLYLDEHSELMDRSIDDSSITSTCIPSPVKSRTPKQ